MTHSVPVAKKRADYQPADFEIEHVKLAFYLDETRTKVRAISTISRRVKHANTLVLDGVDLTLLSLNIDGEPYHDYLQTDAGLQINIDADNFELCIDTQINPEQNSSLEGLYKSAGTYCTQCEAEGFRKITYFLDRPDNLATYDVYIEAEQAAFPYLLSNGNPTGQGELENGKHWVSWSDPYKKPSYLFALVAGDFDLLEDSFSTLSGREVKLQLFVDKGNAAKGEHALASLKKAMAWDEQVYGLEYDLDIYMVVAVDFFNMGAMENKGLNVFNSKFVLADDLSATDEDYFNIESVIAHEYFHNWTGNRVTCRDWFQLSLKEGLTVFRDQQFSSDMASAAINRINNVKVIREHQFAEDASPMSHPIRPDEVMEMNNFYTVTVYNKGAEVISMLHKMLGQTGFRAGMDLYFERHDGQAVTCDDFVNAMADANQKNLNLFKRWYAQSGTPEVFADYLFDEQNQILTLSVKQVNAPTADQSYKQALSIPLDIEVLDSTGTPLPLFSGQQTSAVLTLEQQQQSWSFHCANQPAALCLLRDFSAPVKLHLSQTDEQLKLIMLNASDAFSRFDAWHQLLNRYINQTLESEHPQQGLPQKALCSIKNVLAEVLNDDKIDLALKAEMLCVPSFETMAQLNSQIDVEALLAIKQGLEHFLATELVESWFYHYQNNQTAAYEYNQQQVAKRRMHNVCLNYLLIADAAKYAEQAKQQYLSADNMSDTLGVLKACQDNHVALFDELMADFEQRWQHDALVMDKWFALQAGAFRSDILSRIELLKEHSGFSLRNPNRTRALIGTFAFYNTQAMHHIDGSGYKWLTEQLILLDKINPQVAARIVTPMLQFKRYDAIRQPLIKHQLMRLANQPDLSTDLYEKVSKALNI
ncbi:aminopeptidase N [Neptunicella marina]|uniref:Aminopeptidase N n=1 Tax=Neptunicella marina TaxID=2125989 RepID=A0A8J6M3I3_9ALTE|nr:aminopeptidase N [Neptunicella marina]MBC3767498.1 aminopeptidase N [Neptunicella marina]